VAERSLRPELPRARCSGVGPPGIVPGSLGRALSIGVDITLYPDHAADVGRAQAV
jgi:hypothetical protein